MRGRNNRFIRNGAIVRGVSVEIEGDGNTITVASGAVLSKVRFRIWGSNHRVEIAEGCRIGDGSIIWMQHSNTMLRIGQNTTIESAGIALVEDGMSIDIGEDCMIAYGVDFRTSDSHSVIDLATGKRTNPPGPIVIGDHVWIARNAQICKGVRIAGNSVVASHALVTKDVGPNCIVGGFPARVISENSSWHRELLEPQQTITIQAK